MSNPMMGHGRRGAVNTGKKLDKESPRVIFTV